jgi:hypothetical protein
MTTPNKQTRTMAEERDLNEGFFAEATRIAKEKLGRSRRRKPLSFTAQFEQEMRKRPELRQRYRHETAVLTICTLMFEKGYHATRQRKMEEYLDLVYELGFEVRRRRKTK